MKNKIERKTIAKNVYDLELVRNYYKQKVLSDTLSLGERKRAADECSKKLRTSKELGIQFIGDDIHGMLEKGLFYKSNVNEIYTTLTYTYNQYKNWLTFEDKQNRGLKCPH